MHWLGVHDSYVYVLALVARPAPRLALMLGLVWLHGCIGLHFWLRLRPWYRRLRALALALARAAAGAGAARLRRGRPRAAQRPDADPAWLRPGQGRALAGARGSGALVDRTGRRGCSRASSCAGLGRSRRGGPRPCASAPPARVRLDYPGGRPVALPPRHDVLEASRVGGIPHASVCGGRGRCSTCRVRVGEGAEQLPPPRRGAARARPDRRAPARPAGLPDSGPTGRSRGDAAAAGDAPGRATCAAGSTAARARSARSRCCSPTCATSPACPSSGCPTTSCSCSTAISRRWARDRDARAARSTSSSATASWRCSASRGEPDAACRAGARRGARRCRCAWRELNRELSDELDEPLRIGIGIHAGPAIVGEMGHGRAAALTAIGDTVNTASRLEA